MTMIDSNTAVMLFLLTVKAWAPTLFYVMAIYYIYKQIKKRKK